MKRAYGVNGHYMTKLREFLDHTRSSSPQSFGKHYRYPVELVDIFPTLVDLSGTPLEKPCPVIPVLDKKGSRDSIRGKLSW